MRSPGAYSSSVSDILAASEVWQAYKHQKHDLFLPAAGDRSVCGTNQCQQIFNSGHAVFLYCFCSHEHCPVCTGHARLALQAQWQLQSRPCFIASFPQAWSIALVSSSCNGGGWCSGVCLPGYTLFCVVLLCLLLCFDLIRRNTMFGFGLGDLLLDSLHVMMIDTSRRTSHNMCYSLLLVVALGWHLQHSKPHPPVAGWRCGVTQGQPGGTLCPSCPRSSQSSCHR